MELVIDTSVLIAVLTSEPERAALIEQTRGANLVAPASVHWEVGNALAAMLKRHRIQGSQLRQVLKAYEQIPIRYMDVDLADALDLAAQYGIYAYDAYVISCARRQRCALLSLDNALVRVARAAGVKVLEVTG